MKAVVIGACGPASVNLCRALDNAGHTVVGLDENPYHLRFGQPYGRMILSPPLRSKEFLHLLTSLEPDVVMAQPAEWLEWLAGTDFPTCVPTVSTLRTCRDKPEAIARWAHEGLRSHTVGIFDPLPDLLHVAKEAFGLPFWLRARSGSGARGATLVEDLRTAFHWIRYWQTRGSDYQWVAEEYFPGRDFCWTSLWQHGELVGAFTRERLEWIYPHIAPSGRTGTPTVTVTVKDSRVRRMAQTAVRLVDPSPHGVYCVDLREAVDGFPRPTEINAGRWATTSPLYYMIGPNLPDLQARIAAGETVDPVGDDCVPEGRYLLRHIDCDTRFHTDLHTQEAYPDPRVDPLWLEWDRKSRGLAV